MKALKIAIFGGKMDAIYHYTSRENWKQIQKDGILLPKTYDKDNNGRWDVFLVGLEMPKDKRWIQAGLWYELEKYTMMDLLLEIPILDTERGFVREQWHYSPKGLIERHGINLIPWRDDFELEEFGYDGRKANELSAESYRDYLNSAVPLAEYDGSFRVPEFWLQQETPVEKIRVVGGRE